MPSDLLSSKFSLFDNTTKVINLDEKYNNNYSTYINRKDITKDEFDYYIDGNKEIKSLLYFDRTEEVIQEFLNSINSVEDSNVLSDNSLKNNINETKTIITELAANSTSKETRRSSNYNGELGDKKTREINETNENAGREAEYIAYTELKKHYPDLIWHSKYSNIPADKNKLPPNNVVCDMWSRSNELNVYFEVKSSISEFEMTINEYNSMKENKNNYFVVLVIIFET